MIFSKKNIAQKITPYFYGAFSKNVLVGEMSTSQYLVVVLCELNHAIIISHFHAQFVPNFILSKIILTFLHVFCK